VWDRPGGLPPLPFDRPWRLGRDVIDTQKREDFKARINKTVHDVEFRTSNFRFQPANNASIVEPPLRAQRSNPFFLCAARWIASRSLSSGAHSRDPLARNDVGLQTRIRIPRRDAPEAFHEISRPSEGVGNAGCPWHPRPRVHLLVVESTRVTTSTPESPGVPARNGFNGFLRALLGDRAVLPPSSAD
jgi:hypothetical protein